VLNRILNIIQKKPNSKIIAKSRLKLALINDSLPAELDTLKIIKENKTNQHYAKLILDKVSLQGEVARNEVTKQTEATKQSQIERQRDCFAFPSLRSALRLFAMTDERMLIPLNYA
jgi:hypothetical protein